MIAIALTVPCPNCGAAREERCRTVGGNEQKIAHHLRTAIAHRDAGHELSRRDRGALLRAGLPLQALKTVTP